MKSRVLFSQAYSSTCFCSILDIVSQSSLQVFGVCCNNTLPADFRLPEDFEPVAPENDDEVFPIEASEAELISNCGARFVRPQITLYNQPTAAQRFFAAMPYIVNGNEAIRHEYPFMVSQL